MKTEYLPLSILVVIAALSVLSGCAGGRTVKPVTPPTFVMAWTVDGPSGEVWTVESNDGIIWRNPGPQNLQGNLSDSRSGPAIAHDGNHTWMLMWSNTRGLDYKIGTGGVAPSGQGGVVWEPQPHQGLLPATAIGGSPAGSPALAFGQDRWVAAFRTMGTGDALQLARSQRNSATTWEPARDIEVKTPDGVRSVTTQRDPALAYGQGTFVLIHRGQSSFIASTSPDGVTWTDRGPIAQIPDAEMSDPAVTYSGGNFFVALRKRLPMPPGWEYDGTKPAAAEIYKSANGITWTRIADKAGFFAPIGRKFGPAFSFGDFGNNLCKGILIDRGVHIPAGTTMESISGIQSWTGTAPPPHTCANPSLLQFSPSEAAGDQVTNRGASYRTAVSFGKTGQ